MSCSQPWLPHRPFWEMLSAEKSRSLRETYEETAARLEYGELMPRGMAEAAAYAFMFSDKPEIIYAFVSDEEVNRQLLRAKIIRSTRVRWWEAYLKSFSPWVRQRK